MTKIKELKNQTNLEQKKYDELFTQIAEELWRDFNNLYAPLDLMTEFITLNNLNRKKNLYTTATRMKLYRHPDFITFKKNKFKMYIARLLYFDEINHNNSDKTQSQIYKSEEEILKKINWSFLNSIYQLGGGMNK